MFGSNLTLRCRVRGYPVPTVTWLKDKMQLNANDHISKNEKGDLFIKGLGVGDNGMYTCEASNNLGVDRKQVEVNVQEPITEAPGKLKFNTEESYHCFESKPRLLLFCIIKLCSSLDRLVCMNVSKYVGR